jgi:hypothetical protein
MVKKQSWHGRKPTVLLFSIAGASTLSKPQAEKMIAQQLRIDFRIPLTLCPSINVDVQARGREQHDTQDR